MKPIHKEEEFLDAITKTLHSYEELIDNTAAELDNWHDYGSARGCRICRLYTDHSIYLSGCSDCPLNTMKSAGDDEPRCTTNVWNLFYDKLKQRDQTLSSIRRAAKARYKEIINHLKKYGIEYK